MLATDTEQQLKTMLSLAGFNYESPDILLGWKVFQEFAAMPVEGVDSGILWQIGCYSFTGKKLCHLDFVRQFIFKDEDGEYDGMEQLHFEFTCQPTSELLELERNHWSFDHQSLTEYFATVECFPEFEIAKLHIGWTATVSQEPV